MGAGLATAKTPVLRHVGIQAVVWGAIDAALAYSGPENARNKLQQGTTDAEQQEEAQRFQRIVAINAALDVLYVLGGSLLVRRAGSNEARRGAGIGIIIQGAFLLVYDGVLVWAVEQWRQQP